MDGRAASAALRAELDLEGNLLHAERIRQIAELEGREAVPLLLEAQRRGSRAVRLTALEALAVVDAGVADPIARELLRTHADLGVRCAAAAALGRAESAEAFEALVAASNVDASSLVRVSALESLARHPGAHQSHYLWARFLNALERFERGAVEPGTPPDWPAREVGGLVAAFAARYDRAVEAKFIELWQSSRSVSLRLQVGGALFRAGTAAGRAAVELGLSDPFLEHCTSRCGRDDARRHVIVLATRAALASPPAVAYETLRRHLTDGAIARPCGQERATLVLTLLACQAGDRAAAGSWLVDDFLALQKGARPDPRWRADCERLVAGVRPVEVPGLGHVLPPVAYEAHRLVRALGANETSGGGLRGAW
jgi:HEAT repeat protein